MFILFGECIDLEYARIHAIYRVHQAEYTIRTSMAAPQEYANTYSTRRVLERVPVSTPVVVLWPPPPPLSFYTILPSPIWYGIWHTQGV